MPDGGLPREAAQRPNRTHTGAPRHPTLSRPIVAPAKSVTLSRPSKTFRIFVDRGINPKKNTCRIDDEIIGHFGLPAHGAALYLLERDLADRGDIIEIWRTGWAGRPDYVLDRMAVGHAVALHVFDGAAYTPAEWAGEIPVSAGHR
jgi:hypothetical protein